MQHIRYSILAAVVILMHGVVGASWNLPGIEFIERSEWGADESLKYRNNARLQSAYDHPDYETGRIAGRGSLELLNPDSYEDIIEKGEAVRGFLEELPGYLPQVVTNFVENDNLLSWPQKYTATKKSVTVHHTADGKIYRLPSDSDSGVREVYRQHAVSNEWGDIGYNFLIDPQGRVYEGRSGGAGVVAGHANLRNSISSLGVALLGNFENVRPTSVAMHSLTHLTMLLTYQYSIEPTRSVKLFDKTLESPFIEAHMHDESIVGHKDIKSTACPGEYLYSKIPGVIEEVGTRLKWLDEYGSSELTEDNFITLPRAIWSNDRVGGITIPWNQGISSVSCSVFSQKTQGLVCNPVSGGVRIQIDYQPDSSGRHTIGVVTDRGAKMVSFSIVREQDIQDTVDSLKSQFSSSPPSANQKMVDYILENQAEKYLTDDISVLLYEPTKSGEVSLQCTEGCEVSIDDLTISNAQTIIIRQEGASIVGYIDLIRYEADQIEVKDPLGGVVQIASFERYSGNTPLNIYKGELSFKIQAWRDIDEGMKSGFTVVNTLPFREYIQGMGESSEVQHFEKTKALALLTKTYALFYRSGINPHPSIPQGVSYTAIDDPRSFQRYLGAGIEASSPYWLQAIDATFNTLVLYEGFIPILPYYHCSGGFSWSGQEKFGRTDTPRLVSKKDFVSCELGQFEGHGVGMSGDGAEYLAQVGARAEDILKWWYDGVELIEL